MKKNALLSLLLIVVSLPMFALGETLTLSFVGDCSIGEAIQQRNQEGGYTWMLDQQGYEWPFSLVREYLDNDDFTFANLEVVFTERTKHADKAWPLVAYPRYAQTLLHSGIDAVNTVNNHCFDYTIDGYTDSMAVLDALPISHFGSVYIGGRYEQDVLLTAEVKGIRIGALGFSYPQESDLKLIEKRIQKLREAGCELVIVSLHWGKETSPKVESAQFSYARKVIDMGADILWGHHAHVIQPIQFYHGGVIFYNTGNFTFGTMSSSVDRDTAIFQLEYALSEQDAELSQLRIIPCRTTGKGDYRPYELTDAAERETVFRKLVHPKDVANMQNPPASFLVSGIVLFEDGVPVQ